MQTAPSFNCHGTTDVGRVRQTNQDHFLIADLQKNLLIRQTSLPESESSQLNTETCAKLLVIADGMGGHAAGHRASSMTVGCMTRRVIERVSLFVGLSEESETEFERDLQAAVQSCRRILLHEGEAHPDCHGMGTTLTLACILWPRLYIVHAGDSRCYLLREGQLTQVTTDHTLAQRMVDMGALSPEEAEKSALSNVLWNAVVADDNAPLQTDIHKLILEEGDCLMLCTDGLMKHVAGKAIQEILAEAGSSEEACEKLVETANSNGGTDNTTVIVARF